MPKQVGAVTTFGLCGGVGLGGLYMWGWLSYYEQAGVWQSV